MPAAAIDIGSNSVLLTVVADDGGLLHDEARVVGLGKGLGDRGLFQPERMAAATEALEDYVRIAKELGVEAWSIKAVATSASRRAMNAETYFARLQRKLGLRIKIISGEEEARLTWLGSQRDLEVPEGPRLVIDLGGGSTEMVLGEGPSIHHRVSLEVGHVHLDPAPRTVVGVAGTVTTLATMRLGLPTYDAEAVHGSVLTRADLARFIDQLLPTTTEQRVEMVPSAPKRADYLLAGALILDAALAHARRQQMLVSDRGIRYGLLPQPKL